MNDNYNFDPSEKSLSNAYLALHGIDLVGITEALNNFISINIPNASGIFKTMTIYNEVLSNSIKELDVKSFISSSTKAMEALKSVESAFLSNIDYEEIINEEYTKEIIEQLSDDVEPTEIAQNLEKKTNIKWEVWIPIIIGILQLIWNVYSDINSKPQIINTNNYIIVESHKKEIDEYEKRLDQIDNDMSNKMNNDRNSQK